MVVPERHTATLQSVQRPPRGRFERVSSVVVLGEGIDGSVELLLGVLLLLTPAAILAVLDVAVLLLVVFEHWRLRRERRARFALAGTAAA